MPGAKRWSCCAIRIRLAFAFIGPVILMFACGYGITFDVENLKYAAFDQDQTPESRRLLESFSGSHYFTERPPINSTARWSSACGAENWRVVIEIPSGFGRDLTNLHSPEVAFWIDGAMPFRGETAKGYVTGLLLRYAQDLALGAPRPERAHPTSILVVSILKIASATTRLSRASSPWFRASS